MNTALPPIVDRAQWLAARKALLAREKALTREADAVAAARRRLPMVRIEADYRFTDATGTYTLRDLFGRFHQLYVHHFMWNEESERHCPGCTAAAHQVFNNPFFRSGLEGRDVRFVAISRAPLDKLEAYRIANGWTFPWYSCAGTRFNLDFHITLDPTQAPVEYNYRTEAEWEATGLPAGQLRGDWTGASAFLRDGETVYHTYSAYARGLDRTTPVPAMLDLMAYGRQEDWEDSPLGWPQGPTYG